MPVIRRLLPSILLAAAAGCAGAPHPAPPAPPSLSPTAVGRVLEPESASRQGYVPEEVLERPLPLRQGIGNSHETVTTPFPEAQRYYDQGLNYLESYVWIEAARSFHQALRIDPDLVLAYVGLSRASTGLRSGAQAREYLASARSHAASLDRSGRKITDRERSVLEIREKQLAAIDDPDNGIKLEAYRGAIDQALGPGLDDPQLWLLRGVASEADASGRGQYGAAPSIAYYERVLKLEPDNASAHHYLVHTYEALGRKDDVVRHGERYAASAYSIPHAAHMLGHALRIAGRIEDAILQFQRADSLERAYYRAENIDPSWDWHHEHNLDVLKSLYEQKGKPELAERAVREMASLGTSEADRSFHRKEVPSFLIREGRYEEALREARLMIESPFPQSRAAGHALAGRALLGLGRIEEARQELEAARKDLAQAPRAGPASVPKRSDVKPLVDELEKEYTRKSGKASAGRF